MGHVGSQKIFLLSTIFQDTTGARVPPKTEHKSEKKGNAITTSRISQEKDEGNPQYDNEDKCQQRIHSNLE